jgi:hypothetical protein
MIKKGIASILIILILINSIGCYSYQQIKKEEIEKDNKVKITTLDNKDYYLHNVEIQGSVLKGFKYIKSHYGQRKAEEVVIHLEEIKTLEVLQYDKTLTTIMGGSIIIVLLAGIGLIIYAFSQIEK